jgi:hypothetical protein
MSDTQIFQHIAKYSGHLICIRWAALLYQIPIIVPILVRTFNEVSDDLRTIIVIADIDEGLNQ